MKSDKKIIYTVISALFVSFLLLNSATAEKRPKYSEHVRYSCPDWLSDTEIVYAKEISHFSYHYDWFSSIAKDYERIENKELQICSFNVNDNTEKVIKSIKIKYKRYGNRSMIWEDKMFENVADQMIFISANNKKKIIVFKTRFWDKWPVFVMNYDGTNVRKILDDGSGPIISPDGTKVLFTDEDYVIKYIELESNETYPIVDNALNGIWDSTGSKVIYGTNEKNRRDSKNYILDLLNNKKEIFPIQNRSPENCSADGTKIICGNSMYDFLGNPLEVDNIPNNARFSPDGKHLTGDSGKICILNTDGTGLRVLKTTYSRDYD